MRKVFSPGGLFVGFFIEQQEGGLIVNKKRELEKTMIFQSEFTVCLFSIMYELPAHS